MPLVNEDIGYFKKLLEEIRDELKRISSSQGIVKPIVLVGKKRGRPPKKK